VARNRLTGLLPESLSQLTNLKTMNVSGNIYENGTIPLSFVETCRYFDVPVLACQRNIARPATVMIVYKMQDAALSQ
jgi:hypothetical protein